MKNPPKRILVTGATGFLGRALCQLLESQGHRVIGTSRTGTPLPDTPVLPWMLQDPHEASSLLVRSKADQVVHLAAPIDLRRDASLTAKMQQCIVEAGKALALACEDSGIPLLVAGTCEEYGAQEGPYSETMTAQGISPYSIAKAELTQWLMKRHSQTGLRVAVVRPFLTYGPGQTSQRLIPAAIQAALSGADFPTTQGEQTREVNYIKDMAQALASATCTECSGEILNLGGGPEHSVREIITRIYALADADLNRVQWGALDYREGEVQRFVGDHSKSRRLLNLQPQTGLEDGLRATIGWWRERVPAQD